MGTLAKDPKARPRMNAEPTMAGVVGTAAGLRTLRRERPVVAPSAELVVLFELTG